MKKRYRRCAYCRSGFLTKDGPYFCWLACPACRPKTITRRKIRQSWFFSEKRKYTKE